MLADLFPCFPLVSSLDPPGVNFSPVEPLCSMLITSTQTSAPPPPNYQAAPLPSDDPNASNAPMSPTLSPPPQRSDPDSHNEAGTPVHLSRPHDAMAEAGRATRAATYRFSKYGSVFTADEFAYLATLGWRDWEDVTGENMEDFAEGTIELTGLTGPRWALVDRIRHCTWQAFCCEQGYFLFDPDGSYIMVYAGVDKARMVELLETQGLHGGCDTLERMGEGPVEGMFGYYFTQMSMVRGA